MNKVLMAVVIVSLCSLNSEADQVLKYRESGAINKYYEKYGVPVPAQSLPENHSTP